jgi:hypothetical protein
MAREDVAIAFAILRHSAEEVVRRSDACEASYSTRIDYNERVDASIRDRWQQL